MEWIKNHRVLVGSMVLNLAVVIGWAVTFSGARDANATAAELRHSFEQSEIALGRARSRIADLEESDTQLRRDLQATERELETSLARQQELTSGLSEQGGAFDQLIDRSGKIRSLVATAEELIRAESNPTP